MTVSFLNPLFLLGLASAIIPILIHRLTKRKALTRPFSAVRLLLQSQRRMARPQRLKHLLLLLLRVLAVMTLAVIMARPVLLQPGLQTQGDKGAKVIILDNSASMGFREERGERFSLAKKAAKEVIEGMKGQVTLIPTASIQGKSIQGRDIRWMKPEEALKELSILPLSFGRGDLGSPLKLAYQHLKEFKGARDVLIVSDMARRDWDGMNLIEMGTLPAEVNTTLLRVGSKKRDPNVAVKEVKLVEGDAVVGVPARLEITLLHLSNQSSFPLIQLFLSGIKVDQKSIDFKTEGEGKIYFELSLDKPGWINGEIRISGDPFSVDGVFYFPLKVREKIKVLIVDGSPKTSLKESESYYLANALRPGGSEGSPFLAKVITEEELATIDVMPYEVVIGMNVERFEASKLASILDSGKSFLLFLGDRTASEAYNRFPLFPWRIREARDRAIQKPERIAQIDIQRESLKSFSGQGGESLKNASFWRYYKVEGGTKPLLTFENNDPLLMEGHLGKGNLFLFTSSGDLDWNDLPLKAAYLPLIQGLIKEAVGLSKSSLPPGFRFDPFREEKARYNQIAGPQGGPGIYQLFPPLGDIRRGVNLSLEESDLGKLTDEEMRIRFGTKEIKILEYQEGSMSGLRSTRKELWPYLLAFLLFVLVFEMGVANGLFFSPRQDRRIKMVESYDG